jgi:UPF0755 protein
MTHRASESGGILFRLFSFVLLLCAVGLGAAVYLFNAPYQGFSNSTILDFPKGTSTQAMANELARAGVIRYTWEFVLVRAFHPHSRLQAGEYQFTHADTPWNVFDRILRGDVFFYELIIPEGANIFDIAASVSQFDFIPNQDFLRAARSPALIHDLAPQALTLEGYLFPSTYRITRSTTAQQLCQMMTDLFRKHWREIQNSDHPIAVHEAVTLASLVEKETGVRDERPIVASVFRNRLQNSMPLDCDPTTIYAALLEQRYHGAIYRSDLNSVNKYNTYQHTGLPPGPIANPGAASLKAAVAPAVTDFLYFVARADGSGGHHFSKSIDEHNRAVQEYRRRTSKGAARTHAAIIRP